MEIQTALKLLATYCTTTILCLGLLAGCASAPVRPDEAGTRPDSAALRQHPPAAHPVLRRDSTGVLREYPGPAVSDTAGGRDSTGRALARRDSTALADSLRPVPPSPSGVDSVVNYTATDSVIYRLDNRTMFMYGKGNIKYKDLGLKAERIDINWNTAILNAAGVVDTADTSGKKFRGLPDLVDGGETYHGSVITYNFRTKKGKIDLGKTEIEHGCTTARRSRRWTRRICLSKTAATPPATWSIRTTTSIARR